MGIGSKSKKSKEEKKQTQTAKKRTKKLEFMDIRACVRLCYSQPSSQPYGFSHFLFFPWQFGPQGTPAFLQEHAVVLHFDVQLQRKSTDEEDANVAAAAFASFFFVG